MSFESIVEMQSWLETKQMLYNSSMMAKPLTKLIDMFLVDNIRPDQHFSERIMAVKSFPAGVSVTAQTVLNAL